MRHVAYIGLGSNLGDRQAHILAAAEDLRLSPGVWGVQISTFHETEPVGGPPDQGPYLNVAACVETELEPEKLLDLLLAIETRLGRERKERWGPRTIDLDLLLFDDRVIDSPRLTVPHPRMHERRFVLEPLAEIAPDVMHPVLQRSIADLKTHTLKEEPQ